MDSVILIKNRMIVGKHRLADVVLIDHEFEVPLDHSNHSGEKITIFARELNRSQKDPDKLPWLLFLQGGPGFASPRIEDNSGKWWTRALNDYRVLLLDQRGTGRSSPVNQQTLAKFNSPQAQADYLKFFRADSIVRDSEFIRHELARDEKWSVLGQSYGGFCIVTYLSFAAHALSEVIFTGGLPPLKQNIDNVYRALYKRVLQKNKKYYERYPDDAKRARQIADYLINHEVSLPTGDRLSVKKFQQAGIFFGASDGFEDLHYLLEIAFVSGRREVELNYTFLRDFENLLSFDTNPIYSLLHEPIYCEHDASNWSAERIRTEFPAFDAESSEEVLFTGEMVYPWMFDESPQLRPLKPAAELLAKYADWPSLYDFGTLRKNNVPAVAAVYYDDMYVEREFSEEAAQEIPGIKLWITNEYEHNALRADGERLLDQLLKIMHGEY